MKKVIFIIFLFVLFLLPRPVEAHVLESDGPVGALLHINPDDDPAAGVQGAFFFEFENKNGEFDVNECDCSISIFFGDNVIASEKLRATSDKKNMAAASYTFPTKGMYKIGISGTALDGKSFSPFSFTYDIRVDREEKVKSENQTVKFAIIGVVIVGIVAALFILARKDKKS